MAHSIFTPDRRRHRYESGYTVRVAIAEDSGFFREALAGALTSVGMDVVAAVGDTRALDEVVTTEPLDAVLLDICMPPTMTDEGLVAAEKLAIGYPKLGILVLSAHLGMPHVARLLSISRSGVGCLSKDQLHDADMLTDALIRVSAGGTYIDPQFVDARFRMENFGTSLTPRELEIMRALAQGLSNQGIASRLFINVKTVESAITSIFRKLQLDGSDTNARVCAQYLTS